MAPVNRDCGGEAVGKGRCGIIARKQRARYNAALSNSARACAERLHLETLSDLPASLITPFFANAQLLARAVEKGLLVDGSFVAINNRVSQSVPHLHVHIVPRRKKDGLKGFFWPRQSYRDEEHLTRVQESLRATILELQSEA